MSVPYLCILPVLAVILVHFHGTVEIGHADLYIIYQSIHVHKVLIDWVMYDDGNEVRV